MQNGITPIGEVIAYTLKTHARARRVILRLDTDGEVVIVKPKRVSAGWVEEWVQINQEMIQQKVIAWRLARRQKIVWGPIPSFAQGKENALLFIEHRLAELNRPYGFSYKAVRVRNQKTRWGSCSKRGTISVNYRVVYLPQPLADYILVHELCHLQEMNHSPRFWRLVERTVPDYRERRRHLRKYALQ